MTPAKQSAKTNTKQEYISASGRQLSRNWFALISIIWVGQAISIVTSAASGYAIIWYITETTESAWMLAFTSICTMLPMGLLGPLAGVVADKFNRKLVIIVSDLSSGIIALVLGISVACGVASIPLILVLAFVRGCFNAFHSPAMMATMPMLVPEKHLLRINSLDQLLGSVANIGGPALGIFLYTAIGLEYALYFEFVGSLLAIAALFLVNIPTTHDATSENTSVWQNLHEGYRALRKVGGLIPLLIGITCGMMFFSPLSAIFPLMTYTHFGGDGYQASLVEAIWGAGMLIGAIILMAKSGRDHLVRIIVCACFVVGISTTIAGFLPSNAFIIFLVCMFIEALACAWFQGPTMTLIQTNIPEEKNGRAISWLMTAVGICAPCGVALGGALAELIGVAPFFVVVGVGCLMVGVVMYALPSVRRLDTVNASETATTQLTKEK